MCVCVCDDIIVAGPDWQLAKVVSSKMQTGFGSGMQGHGTFSEYARDVEDDNESRRAEVRVARRVEERWRHCVVDQRQWDA